MFSLLDEDLFLLFVGFGSELLFSLEDLYVLKILTKIWIFLIILIVVSGIKPEYSHFIQKERGHSI